VLAPLVRAGDLDFSVLRHLAERQPIAADTGGARSESGTCRDIEEMRTQAGIESAVVDVPGRFGMTPREPPKTSPVRLLRGDDGQQ